MTINLLSIWIMSTTSINFLYVKVILKKEDLKSSGHSKPFDTHLYLKLFIMGIHLFHIGKQVNLTLSWRRPIQYRNQSIDLRSKSVDWFLYVNGLRHERVKCVKEFSRRFDLPNGKSIFLRVFARFVKVTYFAKIINFRKRTHEKIYPRLIKITENLRYFCFVLFQRNSKTKFIVPLQN